MKSLIVAALAALALAGQMAPAQAFSTATPSIHLVPLAPAQVAVVGGSGCNADAAVSGSPYFEMPQIASEMGASGIAQVKIDLTSSGSLAAAQIFSSSGNLWLDDAALRSARLTQYTSQTINCEHVAGSYLYVVDF